MKTEPTYATMHDDNDSLALLNSIKGIAYKFESQKNIYLSLDNAKAAYYTYRQGREETDSEFAANFGNITKVIEHYGGQVHEDSATLLEELKTSTGDATITINTATTAQLIVAKEARKRKCHGMGMLRPLRTTRHRSRKSAHIWYRQIPHKHDRHLRPAYKLQETKTTAIARAKPHRQRTSTYWRRRNDICPARRRTAHRRSTVLQLPTIGPLCRPMHQPLRATSPS